MTTDTQRRGWRQGSCFSCSIVELKPEFVSPVKEDDIYVVLPYSCAVVNDNESKEPKIELIRGTRGEENKGLQWGRNPRTLQLSIRSIHSGISQAYHFNMHDRFFLPRTILKPIVPSADLELPAQDLNILVHWVAKRYVRGVFPSAFNERTNGAMSKIGKQLSRSPLASRITGLYVRVDPPEEELIDDDDPYEMQLIALMSDTVSQEERREVECFLSTCAKKIEGCNGIFLADSRALSENQITLAEFRDYVRLDDYDFVSFKGDHTLPPAGL